MEITQPFLPPLEEYLEQVRGIWARNWLTNDGPLVRELEAALTEHLGVEHLLYVANGTLALQLACRAVGLEGEVITTPFSHVSTTSGLVWEGLSPRFVDIDPESWCLDPARIEEAVGPRTRGIVATHVYGNPCDTAAIEEVAARHGLKVVYDAAHCFGTLLHGRSVLAAGDASAISFHATKVFHTVEGGAVVTGSDSVRERVFRMRNFGHKGPTVFDGVGINAKASEMHAAMGLTNLPYADRVIDKRRADCARYDARLEGVGLQRQRTHADARPNGAYYAVLMPDGEALEAVVTALGAEGISPRRYFYPPLSALEYVDPVEVPVADDVSGRVLCLPLSFQITEEEIDRVATIVRRALAAGGG